MDVQGPFPGPWWFGDSGGTFTHVTVIPSPSWQWHYEIDILVGTALTPATELYPSRVFLSQLI